MNAQNRFVFVAPMYNASATLPQLLHSLCGQSYKNWKLILIDDVSRQEEVQLERETILQFQCMMGGRYSKNIEEVWNDDKRWEVANVLRGISMCEPDDIVCRIDADDWLTDLDGLAILNQAYGQLDADCIWTAHRWAYSDKNISGPLPSGADPYKHPWVSSHLKTFRKRLLDGVNDENFRGPDGGYITRAGDQAIYLPVLHRARTRVYVPRVMYHYSIDDVPETYQTDDARFQRDEAIFLRQRGFVR